MPKPTLSVSSPRRLLIEPDKEEGVYSPKKSRLSVSSPKRVNIEAAPLHAMLEPNLKLAHQALLPMMRMNSTLTRSGSHISYAEDVFSPRHPGLSPMSSSAGRRNRSMPANRQTIQVPPAALSDYSTALPVIDETASLEIDRFANPGFEPRPYLLKRSQSAALPLMDAKRLRRQASLLEKPDDPFRSIKLGEQRRALIKSAISEKIQDDETIRDRCWAIAKIKWATVSELMQMCEVCGILPWAMNLVNSRKTERHLPKVVN